MPNPEAESQSEGQPESNLESLKSDLIKLPEGSEERTAGDDLTQKIGGLLGNRRPEDLNGEEIERLDILTQQLSSLVNEGKIPGEKNELEEEGKELAQDLQDKLNKRAEELGVDLRFDISPPEMPKGLIEKHLEVFKQFFGGNLEPMVLPKPEDLDDFSDKYTDVMFPRTDEERQQRDTEERNGLIAFRDYAFDRYRETEEEKIKEFDFEDENSTNSLTSLSKQKP